MMRSKKLIIAFVGGIGIISCGGGVYSTGANGELNSAPPTSTSENSESNLTPLGKTIESEYGTASMVFQDGVVYEELPNQDNGNNETKLYRANYYYKKVVVPHTGTKSVELKISDPDSTEVYVLGEVGKEGKVPLGNFSFFGIVKGSGKLEKINGYDSLKMTKLSNYPAIKVQIKKGQGILNWKFQDSSGNSEGKTYVISKLRAGDLLKQGDDNYIDVGDYFKEFYLYFNALPNVWGDLSENCPFNAVDTNGDGKIDRYEIPPSKDCIEIRFGKGDSISYNPQYSLDGHTFHNIIYGSPIIISPLMLKQGSTISKQIIVREYIDSSLTIMDQTTRTINIYKDIDREGHTNLVGTVKDYTSGHTWNVKDSETIVFADSTYYTIGEITVKGSSAPHGTCYVSIKKDGKEVKGKEVSCDYINVDYKISSADKGTGYHTLEFVVYKYYKAYKGGKLTYEKFKIDKFTVNYKVNISPSVKP